MNREAINASLEEMLEGGDGQRQLSPRLLSGSAAKTAFALRLNAERMIEVGGLEATGFLTLTVGDVVNDLAGEERFEGIRDAREASRRINNLNRRVLSSLFERAIVVTERTRRGWIHFHVLGTLRGRPDIRSGFNFEAIGRRDYRSASETLRGLWATLREVLPRYGFGRAELTPVRKTGASVASYVSKYIEKNVSQRTADDRRKKLVRYIGDWLTVKTFAPHEAGKLIAKGIVPKSEADFVQTMTGRRIAPKNSAAPVKMKPNDFAWGSKRAGAWRKKTAAAAALVGIDSPETAAREIGPRWAWAISNIWRIVDDKPVPFLIANFLEREFIRAQLANACENWARWADSRKRIGAEWIAETNFERLAENQSRTAARFNETNSATVEMLKNRVAEKCLARLISRHAKRKRRKSLPPSRNLNASLECAL